MREKYLVLVDVSECAFVNVMVQMEKYAETWRLDAKARFVGWPRLKVRGVDRAVRTVVAGYENRMTIK